MDKPDADLFEKDVFVNGKTSEGWTRKQVDAAIKEAEAERHVWADLGMRSPEEIVYLARDIQRQGLLESIKRLKSGLVVDGSNRNAALKLAGIPEPKAKRIDLDDDAPEVLDLIRTLQQDRRKKLTTSQLTAYAWAAWHRSKKGNKEKVTQAEVARRFGVVEKQLAIPGRVYETDPVLLDGMKAGHFSINRADVITKLKPDKLRAFLAQYKTDPSKAADLWQQFRPRVDDAGKVRMPKKRLATLMGELNDLDTLLGEVPEKRSALSVALKKALRSLESMRRK